MRSGSAKTHSDPIRLRKPRSLNARSTSGSTPLLMKRTDLPSAMTNVVPLVVAGPPKVVAPQLRPVAGSRPLIGCPHGLNPAFTSPTRIVFEAPRGISAYFIRFVDVYMTLLFAA